MKKKEKLRKKKINSVRTTLLIYVDKEIETKLKFQRQMNINGYNPLVIFKHYTEMNNTITFTNPITTYSTYNNELNNSNSNSSSSYSLFQTRKKICTNLLRKLSNNEGEMIFNKKRHVSQMKLNLYSKPSYESGFIYNDSLEQKDNDKRYELYIKSCKYLIELAETLFPNAPSVRREIDGALFSFRPNYANDEQVNNNSSENISLSQEEHEDYFVPYKQELDLVPKEFQFKLGDSASGSASNSSIRFHHFDSFSSFDL
jgi:hypothetical protein